MLASTLTAANSIYFFIDNECIYSVAECLYDVSDALHVLPLNFSTRRETNEHGNGPVLVARAVAPTNVPARAVALIISYQSEK